MNKAIIILTGIPEGKNKWDDIVKKTSWVWGVNPKNALARIAKNNLFWDGERTEQYSKFLSEFLSLVNLNFQFEEVYTRKTIEKFLKDEDEYKIDVDQTKFNNFLLVIHGTSKTLSTKLKDEFGAFQIHVTSRILNSNVEPHHDFILYEDDENFESEVERILSGLTQDTKKEG